MSEAQRRSGSQVSAVDVYGRSLVKSCGRRQRPRWRIHVPLEKSSRQARLFCCSFFPAISPLTHRRSFRHSRGVAPLSHQTRFTRTNQTSLRSSFPPRIQRGHSQSKTPSAAGDSPPSTGRRHIFSLKADNRSPTHGSNLPYPGGCTCEYAP